MSILFNNLSSYIQHIPKISSGIYLTYGKHNKEYFTCGNHIIFQIIKNKSKYKNCNLCLNKSSNITNVLESLLFTDISIYLQHIPINLSGLLLLSGSHNKEYFTCNKHVVNQIIRSKTQFGYKCNKCINKIIDNTNILSSFLFTNLSIYIKHIPIMSTGINLSENSNKKEYFFNNDNFKLQIINNKNKIVI